MDTLICRGRTDCTAFGVFIAIVFTVIFLNYIQRCIQSHRSNSSNLPLYNTNNNQNQNQNQINDNNQNPNPPNTPLSEDSPLYRFALKSMPSKPYEPKPKPENGNSTLEQQAEKESCAICLGEFEKREKIRVLPKCKHIYHEECIDQWLLRALHCPICRSRVVDFQQHHPKILNATAVQIRLNNHFPAANLVLV